MNQRTLLDWHDSGHMIYWVDPHSVGKLQTDRLWVKDLGDSEGLDELGG